MKLVQISLVIILLLASLATPVAADGQYGNGAIQPTPTPQPEVVHEPVEAGIADNPTLLVAGTFGVAAVLFALSKKTRTAYLPR